MVVKITLLISYCLLLMFLLCQFSNAAQNGSDIYYMDSRRVMRSKRGDEGSCTTRQDCNFLGSCVGNPGNKYCDCFPGISGNNCEIVDECVNNPNMCGNDPDVSCGFHRRKRWAICECDTFGKRFDVPTKSCVDQKTCQSFKECFNGADCINENHDYNKKDPHYCDCKFGTSGDYCERVEECINNPNHCGEGADVECRYNSYLERAYCQCKNQNQRFDLLLKKCVDRKKCRTNEDCLPFGVCHNKCTTLEPCLDYNHIEDKRSCHCVEGTSGENCEVIDDCHNKIVDCGTSDEAKCDYYYNHGLTAYAFCRCKDRSLAFDHHDKNCKECNCGSKSNGCNILNGKKKCNCNYGYKDIDGVCQQE